jgi:heme exporter protein B
VTAQDWRRAWAVAWKDLVSERRGKTAFNAMAFFAAIVVIVFGLALGPDRPSFVAGEETLLQYLAPGLFWIAVFFAGVLAVARSFASEIEGGTLDTLRLYPGDRRALCVGKIVANCALLIVLEIALLPMVAVLYSVDLWSRLPSLMGVALLATVGFATVGTLFAAMTATLRAREVLLPVLLFPMLVPLVLAAVKATTLVLRGDMMGELAVWITLLVAFDLVFLVVGTLTFEYVLDD